MADSAKRFGAGRRPPRARTPGVRGAGPDRACRRENRPNARDAGLGPARPCSARRRVAPGPRRRPGMAQACRA